MQLGRMKSIIHTETNRLTASIDDLLKHVDFAWEQTSPLLNTWKSYANQLWLLGLSVTLMTLLVPLTLSIGMLLGSTDSIIYNRTKMRFSVFCSIFGNAQA